MAETTRPKSCDDFEIAIICTLPSERNAVETLLDERYAADGFLYGKVAGDNNVYTLGRMGEQNVVLANMPEVGTISAAAVVANLHSNFPRIKVGFRVGVCGGAPRTKNGDDILLGDIIISSSVVQVDLGRQYPRRYVMKTGSEETLGRADSEVRSFVGRLSDYLVQERLRNKISSVSSIAYPGVEHDVLFPAGYRHKHRTSSCILCSKCKNNDDEVCSSALETSCESLGCNESISESRNRIRKAMGISQDNKQLTSVDIQEATKPSIHFGKIAISNDVLKSGQHRDQLTVNENVIGFTMDGMYTWDKLPILMIKSVYNYADSHRSKLWLSYAATTAAACLKAVLEEWQSDDQLPQQKDIAVGSNQHSHQHASALVQSPVLSEKQPGYYPIHFIVPRKGSIDFVGREDILHELQNTILASEKHLTRQDTAIIVVYGIGGQGKSEMCLQLVYRLRHSFWGIFWIDVSTDLTTKNGFLDIATRMRVGTSTWTTVRDKLENIREEPWLLILDNADDPTVDYQQFFPSSTSGVIILTSRNPECQMYASVREIELKGLTESEACALLFRKARVPEDQNKEVMVRRTAAFVAVLLGFHPLALSQAGSYIYRGHCTFQTFPKFYERQRKRLLGFNPPGAQSRYGNVYSTFEVAADMFHAPDTIIASDALELLSLLASYGASQLPLLPLLETAWTQARGMYTDELSGVTSTTLHQWHRSRFPQFLQVEADVWDSFRVLEAFHQLRTSSLVAFDSRDTSLCVSMHPLACAWAMDRLNFEKQHEAWVTATSLVAVSQMDTDFCSRYECSLQHHVLILMSVDMYKMFAGESEPEIGAMLIKCGWLLQKMHCYAFVFDLLDGLHTYLRLSKMTVKAPWIDLYSLSALNHLKLGRYKEAILIFEQIVAFHVLSVPKDHLNLFKSQLALAEAYQAEGKMGQAISLLQHMLETYHQIQQDGHLDQLKARSCLAQAYRASGEVGKAISLQQEVVGIYEQTLSEDHPDRLLSQRSLAEAYLDNRQVEEAVRLLERVATIEKGVLSISHPDRAKSLHSLANAYLTNGQTEEAVSLLEEVVKVQDYVLSDKHPLQLRYRQDLALAYAKVGRFKDAASLMKFLIEAQERSLGPEHASTVKLVSDLGDVYRESNQLEKAEEMYNRTLSSYEHIFGLSHPTTLSVVANMAILYDSLGKPEMAKQMYQRVIIARDSSLGSGVAVTPVPASSRDTPSLTYGPTHIISDDEPLSEMHKTPIIVSADEQAGSSKNLEDAENNLEIVSLQSFDDDDETSYSSRSSSEAKIAHIMMSREFAKHGDFVKCCSKALLHVSRSRLVRNLKRLLKPYRLELQKQARLPAHILAIAFLKGPKARAKIATAAVERIFPSLEDVANRHRNEDFYLRTRGQVRVLGWLRGFDSQVLEYETGEIEAKDIESEGEGSNSSTESEEEEPNSQKLEQLKDFFVTGPAFNSLLVGLRSFYQPPSSPSLMRILLTLPQDSISIIDQYEVTIADSLRLFIERLAGESWDWWPFPPPQPQLRPNFSRVLWTCHCGERLWADIPKTDTENYLESLRLRGEWRSSAHLCIKGKWGSLRDRNTTQKPSSSASSSGQLPSSSNTNFSSAGLGGQGTSPGNTAVTTSGTSNTAGQTQIQQSLGSNSTPTTIYVSSNSQYILFGVEDHTASVDIAHLDVAALSSDGEFFKALKTEHSSRRSWLQHYASIWRFTHCDFVKFGKFRPNEVITHCCELPSDSNYQYTPRPPHPDAEDPAITKHEFRKSLDACGVTCRDRWYYSITKLLWKHKCFLPSQQRFAIQRTPKKIDRWLIDTESLDKAWGLRSSYEASVLRILLYHLIIFSPSIVFMILWLFGSPKDVQNATVPITLELGGISLFWAL